MKVLPIAVVIAFVISSCKKNVDPNTSTPGAPTAGPTFVLGTLGNVTYTPPQTAAIIFDAKLAVGTRQDFFVRGATITAATTGGNISNYKNPRYSLLKKNNAFAVSPSLLSATLTGPMTSIAAAPLDTGEVCTARLTVDVTTAGFTGTVKLTVSVSYDFWDPVSKSKKSGALSLEGQMITFAEPTLVTAIHSSNPQSGLLIAGQVDTTLSIALTAQAGDLEITSFPITCDNQLLVDRFEVYQGTTQLTSVSVFSTDTLRASVNVLIPVGTTEVFTFRPVPKQITSDAQSGLSIKTTVANIRYEIASTGDQKVATTPRIGNDHYVVKSITGINVVQLTNATIVNGVSRPVLHFFVSASSAGPISWKTIAESMQFGDQTPDDTLFFNGFKFYEGPQTALIDRSGLVKFFDVNGQIDSVYTETDTKYYVMWLGGINEDIVAAGMTKEYWIYMKPNGFQSGGGDDVTLRTEADNIGMDHNRLTTVPGTQLVALTNGSSVLKANFICSDRSAGGAHSASTSGSSSKGWMPSTFIKNMAYSQVLHQ